MTRMSDDGPLVREIGFSPSITTKKSQLLMHNLAPRSSSAVPPPPYTPPLDPNFYSGSGSPPKPHESSTMMDSAKRNRRNACICMGVGIVMFVAVPAAIFGGIISSSHTNCVQKTPANAGALPNGEKFCWREHCTAFGSLGEWVGRTFFGSTEQD